MDTLVADPVSSFPISASNAAPPRRLFTVADLAKMPTELDGGPVKYELNDGVLVVMPPPGYNHARHQAKIVIQLGAAEDLGLGEVCGDVSIVLRHNPDRVVGPDAAFILAASLPVRRSPEGYLETIPELVVEVRSKNDTNPELVAKAEEYFQAGVRVLWIVDPIARTVAAHRPDTSVQLFREADVLSCDLLPGFGVPVARLFAGA